ncbi:chitinase [Cubamyces menziesii]|nr:chitinase [Cubamyces menziesii]
MLSFLYLALFVALPFSQAKLHRSKRSTCKLPSSTSSSNPQPTSTQSSGSRVAAAWYAGYHSSDFPLSSVSWNKYTHLTYSFALTTGDTSQLEFDSSDATLLPQFVKAAHSNNVKALVSVGGWGGSHFYSANVGSAANRTTFVKTLTDFASKYDIDGIDFDWEYPNAQGIGCNVLSPDDTTNFLSFLQELRQDPVGKKLILTAATSVLPWQGPNGSPLTDVSGFAKTLDWIEIMNYDVWGSWSDAVGPNAPLADACAPTQDGSATSAVAAWTAAGMPANQIVLGVPAYGHSFYVTKTAALSSSNAHTLNAYPAFDKSKQPAGDKWDDAQGSPDGCGGTLAAPGGDITFWGLVDAGYLTSNGTAAPGIDYRFDACSQTPYVYNESTDVMVSFDDARSFAAKGQFIKSQKLLGFSMWEAGGDHNDILLDSIRDAVGF